MDHRFFQECGRRGGRKRARNLSHARRSTIASHAALARWRRPLVSTMPTPSVRFDECRMDDPACLEELLLDGSLSDWGRIYFEIDERPFGLIAQAFEKIVSSTNSYGITRLWKGILKTVQGFS